jgi:hypothetical protein
VSAEQELNERIRDAGLAFTARLRDLIGVYSGEQFTRAGLQATIDVFNEQERLYGQDEARRIMRAVTDILGEAMQTVDARKRA